MNFIYASANEVLGKVVPHGAVCLRNRHEEDGKSCVN